MEADLHYQFPPLIEPSELAKRVKALAGEIVAALGTEPIIVVALLKGAFVFTADLVRALSQQGISSEIEFLIASSYGAGTYSTGQVTMHWLGKSSLAGRRVLLIDDILDTGLTLSKVKEQILKENPASCHVVVLLDKPSRRNVQMTADFVGFPIDDHFVVGYGLDYAEQHRDLPYVAILPPEARSSGS